MNAEDILKLVIHAWMVESGNGREAAAAKAVGEDLRLILGHSRVFLGTIGEFGSHRPES